MDEPVIGRARLFVLGLAIIVASLEVELVGPASGANSQLSPSLLGVIAIACCLWAPRILNRILALAFWSSTTLIAAEIAILVLYTAFPDSAAVIGRFTLGVEYARVLLLLIVMVAIYSGVAIAATRRLKPRTHALAFTLVAALALTYIATQMSIQLYPDAWPIAGWSYLAALFGTLVFPFFAETPLEG